MITPLMYQPSSAQMQRVIDTQSLAPYTYEPVGMTSATPAQGYVRDHNRVQVGSGKLVFEKSVVALQSWRNFDLGWVKIYPTNAPIAEGTTIAMAANAMGLWCLNACRIVYMVDERAGDLWRFGFAYGTLPKHIARGEERFFIEWDRRDDSVCYDILAYSQPHALLARLGYPLVRLFQKRFARDSKQVMVNAVSKQQTQVDESERTIG